MRIVVNTESKPVALKFAEIKTGQTFRFLSVSDFSRVWLRVPSGAIFLRTGEFYNENGFNSPDGFELVEGFFTVEG